MSCKKNATENELSVRVIRRRSHNKITKLKEQVALLEAFNAEYSEKVKWQMDKLMKCDKEKESLEAKVSILLNEIEVLSNDRDTKIATLETDLKVKDEQIIAANMEYLKVRTELAQLQSAMMTLVKKKSFGMWQFEVNNCSKI